MTGRALWLGASAAVLLLALTAVAGAQEGGAAPAPGALVVPADGWARARSAAGLVLMIGIAFALSSAPRLVDRRLVVTGVLLQVVLAVLTLSPPGRLVFGAVNDGVRNLLSYTEEGASFLFGDLAKTGSPAYLAFGVLPTIIFFASVMAVLYHLGIMQRVVAGLAWVMRKTMRTSGAETLSAAGNIFVGQTEAPLLVAPFIKDMTTSELMAVMTGGFATVAGGVMVAFVALLHPVFPDIAGHLLCASIMSAPAALVVAKIMVPEPDPSASKTFGGLKVSLGVTDANVIDAAARGAADGLRLALNVGAMLLAFISLIALLNGVIGALGGLVAPWLGYDGPVTLQLLLGILLAPLAWCMGVPWSDAPLVGSLLGVKTVLNEFYAYVELSQRASELSPRALLISTYALCGFANFSSIAIQLGGISPLAPERRSDLARLGLRAMIGGTLAAFMTACVVGVMV